MNRGAINEINKSGHLEIVKFLSSFDARYTGRGLYINQNGYYKKYK
jgi:hypothetical protein